MFFTAIYRRRRWPLKGLRNKLLIVLLLAVAMSVTACGDKASRPSAPKIRHGVLDLSEWRLEGNGPVDLVGEWEFYWDKLVTSGEFEQQPGPEMTGYFDMPGYWTGKRQNDRRFPADGYATFRLNILMGGQKGYFALKLLDLSSAYTCWINGRQVDSAGIVATKPERSKPQFSPKAVSFRSETDTLEIILQISNFHHRFGGPWEVIRFGRDKDMHALREKQVATSLFLFGSILIIGLYHLGLFVLRKHELPPLYFGLFCMMIALRPLATGEKYLVNLMPFLDWGILFKIEYLSFYIAAPLFTMFIHSIFRRDFSKWVLRAFQAAGVVFSTIVILFPVKIFTCTVQVYQLITLIGCAYVIFVLVSAAIRGRDGAVTFLLGFLILFLSVFNDILYANTLINTGYVVPFGLFVFIFFQSFLLSSRYAMAFTTIEIQREALQETNASYQLEIKHRKKAQDELNTYHGRLKELVAQRTEALTLTNRQLQDEIFEREKSEQALSESKALFDAFMRYLPALAFMKDSGGRYIYLNEACIEFYGVAVEDRIGKTDFDLFPDSVAQDLVENDQKVLREGRVLTEVERLTIEGKTYYHMVSKFPIVKNDEPHILAGIAFDITDRMKAEKEKKRLEVQLQRSHKMEALGLLAGGVAHDLNNVLSGIVSYPELILMDLPSDSPLRNPLLTIQKSGQKAAEIVQDLLTLARRGVSNTEVLNLNDLICEYLESPEHQKLISYHHSVSVESRPDPDLFNTRCSAIHLKKSIMNLLSNAAEAQTKGGRIVISTDNRYVDRPIEGYNDVREGDYAVLSVEDYGSGIEPEDLKRIFEPFYTKKVMGRSGTGLGMAVVWGTVQDHNGYIHVDSTPGKGTRFELYFPATRKDLSTGQDSISMKTYMGKGESVLVIDDVSEQREIASSILTKLGYCVIALPSGEDALDYLGDHSADVIVLDMIMDPGMDGLDTYRRISALHPGQKAVIASGYSETQRVRQTQQLGAGEYIKKPYTIENLGLTVKRELEK